ncbi:MAG: FlgD immunoglobulin-like domain containing protein [Legionella sp.]|nr:FlgD immunoglobulin-like domain containing protein [Legionella sp.]
MLNSSNVTSLNAPSNHLNGQAHGTQLSQDDFMKILLTQMRLQTPQNPFDSNTMMQQMSQLTNLSATKDMENAVKSLNTNLGTNQVLSASQLVGKNVQVPNDLSPLIAGEGLKGSVILPQDVENTTVTIKDQSGKVVKTIELGASSSGVVDFTWDGMDGENNAMTPGFYSISATTQIKGENVALRTAGTFKVNSVALDKNGNGVILNLDGLGGVNMKDLIKIL